jgi:hypothetical protein
MSEFTNLRCALAAAVTLGVAGLAPLTAAHAQAAFGGATSVTARDCTPSGPTSPCPGTGREPVFTFAESGGPQLSSNTTLSLSDGSTGFGSVTFGALDLPILHASSNSGPNTRINSNNAGYQEFTYDGATASAFSIQATLQVDGSSISDATGQLPLGSHYDALIEIFDTSAFSSIAIPDDILTDAGISGCGASGLLAFGEVTGPGSGPLTVTVSTQSCSGSPLMITPGEQFIVAAELQTASNRGGFIDVSHTFTTALDPTLGADVVQNLETHLVSAESGVPEPAIWSFMLIGFGGLGAALRAARRRALLA